MGGGNGRRKQGQEMAGRFGAGGGYKRQAIKGTRMGAGTGTGGWEAWGRMGWTIRAPSLP
jgi:hypothetical protein